MLINNFNKLVSSKYDICLIDYFSDTWIRNNMDIFDILKFNNVKYDGKSKFPFGHGIAIKSIIDDINPNSNMLLIAIGTDTRACDLNNIFNAIINYGICNIINISFGFVSIKDSVELKRMRKICNNARNRDIMIVCSKSNDGLNSFPANFSSVLSVGFNLNQKKDIFINKNNCKIKKINLLVPWCDGRKMWVYGNSFYTPIITGIISKYYVNKYDDFFNMKFIHDVSKYFNEIKILK